MDLATMIEGQNGLNWPRWQRITRAVEDLGFAGLSEGRLILGMGAGWQQREHTSHNFMEASHV